MRLIDADELKKELHNFFDGKVIDEPSYILRDVFCYIDNAPTIEPFEKVGAICNENCGMTRPHGKWEEDWQEDLDFMSRKGWKCPFCKWRTTYGTPNFCMNCGADLREDSDE